MATVMKALEMFNELVQKGYVIPASEHHSLKKMSIYRSVPSIMTSGSGSVAGAHSATPPNAQLDSPPKGNSGN